MFFVAIGAEYTTLGKFLLDDWPAMTQFNGLRDAKRLCRRIDMVELKSTYVGLAADHARFTV